eukprot:XP_765577.1 hypothetical protein [Theileria parva strain Muguga]
MIKKYFEPFAKRVILPNLRRFTPHKFFQADSKLYLFGGYSYTGGFLTCQQTGGTNQNLMSYHLPEKVRFTLFIFLGYTGIRMGRAILYFGGCNYTYNAHRCYNNVWNYDTIGDKWTIVPSSFEKPLERGHSFLFYSQNSIILYGGSKLDNVIYNDMWKLSMLLPCTDPKYSCFGNGECSGSSCTCFTGFLGHDCGTEQ